MYSASIFRKISLKNCVVWLFILLNRKMCHLSKFSTSLCYNQICFAAKNSIDLVSWRVSWLNFCVRSLYTKLGNLKVCDISNSTFECYSYNNIKKHFFHVVISVIFYVLTDTTPSVFSIRWYWVREIRIYQ